MTELKILTSNDAWGHDLYPSYDDIERQFIYRIRIPCNSEVIPRSISTNHFNKPCLLPKNIRSWCKDNLSGNWHPIELKPDSLFWFHMDGFVDDEDFDLDDFPVVIRFDLPDDQILFKMRWL